MVTVEEAKRLVIENTKELTEVIQIKLTDALGYKLAQDVYSPLDLPPFNQSNVDGYAVTENDSNSWNLIYEVKAGDQANRELNKNEAARIFTGAMVPVNSYCIIMQEKVGRDHNNIYVVDYAPISGEHIREKGSQIKRHELAVKQNTVLTPSIIGFIASLGIAEISVYRKPSITLLVTGNELQTIGSTLEDGKVYESNSSSLSAAINCMGLTLNQILFVKDDKASLTKTVSEALNSCDVLLISGGISVGDYDFVNEALTENNTKTLFYKVAQKPGKPLFFGTHEQTYVFGLPGNPASVLTCFYEYVYTCLRKLSGKTVLSLPTILLPLKQDIKKKKGLANFLKAHVGNNEVACLEGQESFKMRSFTETNAFIFLPMDKENCVSGELVEVHLLPEQ